MNLKRALLVIAVPAATTVVLTSSASAGVVLNTIDRGAILDAGGHGFLTHSGHADL